MYNWELTNKISLNIFTRSEPVGQAFGITQKIYDFFISHLLLNRVTCFVFTSYPLLIIVLK